MNCRIIEHPSLFQAIRHHDTMNDVPIAKKPHTEIVIPDYSNAGVALRVLMAVNVVIFAVCVIQARGVKPGLYAFVDTAVLVELACLSSIFVLYIIRRVLQYSGAITIMSVWMQRGIGVLVPSILTGMIITHLQPYEWLYAGGGSLSGIHGVAIGALFGIAFQHYFELRARAFSPALSEARLQALQARIHPHFLFNSLNAVLSLIRTEPRKAETALEDLAELFRVSMRDAREMTRLNEEIRLCKQYLSLEKIRLGERLQVQWDMEDITDEELYTAQIATLMLQPLLENAVNYGVEPVPHPTLIEVKVACSLGSVEIVVANPVPPAANAAAQVLGGNRMALRNIRERLMLLYDVEAQLTSETVDGKFVVRLRFPYRWGLA